jgi:predicted DNA-binding transcriptional regulator AlpA
MPRKTGRPPIDPRMRQWVRKMYDMRLATQTELAKFLGYSQSTVHRMISYG